MIRACLVCLELRSRVARTVIVQLRRHSDPVRSEVDCEARVQGELICWFSPPISQRPLRREKCTKKNYRATIALESSEYLKERTQQRVYENSETYTDHTIDLGRTNKVTKLFYSKLPRYLPWSTGVPGIGSWLLDGTQRIETA